VATLVIDSKLLAPFYNMHVCCCLGFRVSTAPETISSLACCRSLFPYGMEVAGRCSLVPSLLVTEQQRLSST
jgi:hypothetical protein